MIHLLLANIFDELDSNQIHILILATYMNVFIQKTVDISVNWLTVRKPNHFDESHDYYPPKIVVLKTAHEGTTNRVGTLFILL